jgi:hypothetical protein
VPVADKFEVASKIITFRLFGGGLLLELMGICKMQERNITTPSVGDHMVIIYMVAFELPFFE